MEANVIESQIIGQNEDYVRFLSFTTDWVNEVIDDKKRQDKTGAYFATHH